MRPIERKVLKKIGKDGITLHDIEEIVDGTPRQEMKKSFPDDCHFQTTRYFAKTILDSLLRVRLIRSEGGKYIKIEVKKDDNKPSQ